jgi:hydrogenase nickel incorporation protein HypA/HybF
MHESSLIPELVQKLAALAVENGARRVMSVDVTIGALTGMDGDHLRDHFNDAAAGTAAEGAEVRCRISEDPMSTSVIIDSVELER